MLGVASPERMPFDESITDPRMHRGVNQLIASLRQAGLGMGSNVYAEMGSAWSNVMNDAVAAQHYVGKLLKYLGPDNVVCRYGQYGPIRTDDPGRSLDP